MAGRENPTPLSQFTKLFNLDTTIASIKFLESKISKSRYVQENCLQVASTTFCQFKRLASSFCTQNLTLIQEGIRRILSDHAGYDSLRSNTAECIFGKY